MVMLTEEECKELWKPDEITDIYEFINKVYALGYEQGLKDYDYFATTGILIV